MTRTEKINLVLLGLKAGRFNDKIEVDGVFAGEGETGLDRLLSISGSKNPDGVDLMITVFKNLGFNPKLNVGGWIGNETRQAVRNFRQFLKKK